MTVAVQLWPPEVVTRTWPPTARGSVDRTPQEPSGSRRGRAGAGALATGTGELVPNPSAGSVGLVPKSPSEEPAELVPNPSAGSVGLVSKSPSEEPAGLVPNPSAGSVGLVPKPPSEEPAGLVPNHRHPGD